MPNSTFHSFVPPRDFYPIILLDLLATKGAVSWEGGAADSITGRAGNDTIDLLEAVPKVDTVVMTGAIAGLGADSITGSALGTGLFTFTGANIGDENTTLTVTTAAAASAATLSESNVFTTRNIRKRIPSYR